MEGKFRRATRIREYFNNLESRVASGEREEQPDVYDKNDWWFAALCTILLSQRGIIRAKEYFSSSEEIVFSNESLSLSFPLSSSIDILFLDIICRRISPRTNENNPFSQNLPPHLSGNYATREQWIQCQIRLFTTVVGSFLRVEGRQIVAKKIGM